MVRTRDTIAKSVDKLVIRLAKLNVEFVLSQEELIEKLCHFKGESINHFKTYFKRIDINFIHDKSVIIGHVLSGHTKIWTDDEKKSERKMESVNKLVTRLAELNLEFVLPLEELVLQMCNFDKDIYSFKTQFRRIDIDYIHDRPVGIGAVLCGNTKIWTVDEKRSKRDSITKLVDKWVTRLDELNVEFVLSREDLIEHLCNLNSAHIYGFKTQFKQKGTGFTYDKPVGIGNVLHGKTKIWTDEEKKAKQRVTNEKNTPRGIDTGGDKETERFFTFFKLFPNLSKRFKVTETVRGSLVDIILTSKRDSSISFGLQIATSKMCNGRFYFRKTITNVLKYLEHNLFILCIGMFDDQVAGVYLIPPTTNVKEGFKKFKDSMEIASTMLSHKQSSSDFVQFLHTFRYISSNFQDGVKGPFKNLTEFSDDFLTMLCENYDKVVNTFEHFSSLFTGASERTEWAAGRSFEMVNDIQELRLTISLIHGERGDVKLKLDNEHEIVDERKTLSIGNGSKSWELCLRRMGQQGLNPLKVNTTTAFIRCDRYMKWPRESKDFIGFVFFPVLTASGNLALRPDIVRAHGLCMSCDTNNHDEWIRINRNKVGNDAYPEHMTEIIPGSKYIKIRAVFYYDTLTKGSERWNDFLCLFRLFAKRVPTQVAIDAYNNAMTPELIEEEKQRLGKNSKTQDK
jgi:hypothetical protein